MIQQPPPSTLFRPEIARRTIGLLVVQGYSDSLARCHRKLMVKMGKKWGKCVGGVTDGSIGLILPKKLAFVDLPVSRSVARSWLKCFFRVAARNLSDLRCSVNLGLSVSLVG